MPIDPLFQLLIVAIVAIIFVPILIAIAAHLYRRWTTNPETNLPRSQFRCDKCGFDLTGSYWSGECSECGHAITCQECGYDLRATLPQRKRHCPECGLRFIVPILPQVTVNDETSSVIETPPKSPKVIRATIQRLGDGH